MPRADPERLSSVATLIPRSASWCLLLTDHKKLIRHKHARPSSRPGFKAGGDPATLQQCRQHARPGRSLRLSLLEVQRRAPLRPAPVGTTSRIETPSPASSGFHTSLVEPTCQRVHRGRGVRANREASTASNPQVAFFKRSELLDRIESPHGRRRNMPGALRGHCSITGPGELADGAPASLRRTRRERLARLGLAVPRTPGSGWRVMRGSTGSCRASFGGPRAPCCRARRVRAAGARSRQRAIEYGARCLRG